MTVKELKEELCNYPDDAEVFVYDASGEYEGRYHDCYASIDYVDSARVRFHDEEKIQVGVLESEWVQYLREGNVNLKLSKNELSTMKDLYENNNPVLSVLLESC